MLNTAINSKRKLLTRAQEAGVLIGILGYIAYWSIPGLLKQYSFWRDEIFTAAFVSGSWQELLVKWVAADVHPPLYFLLSKSWAALLGTSELALRGFSFIFAIATVVMLWNDWRRNKRIQRLTALLLISSSPTFLYYSQEARSYSLMLFLSTWLILRILRHRYESKQLLTKNEPRQAMSIYLTYALCLLLSLTHYFGLIFTIIILIYDCLEKTISRRLWPNAIVICLVCLWPAFHIGYLGNLGTEQQELTASLTSNFQPVISTLSAYIYSTLHYIRSGILSLDYLIIVSLFTAILWSAVFCTDRSTKALKTSADLNYVGAIISITLICLILADIYSPITTARNCIVLLYPTCVLTGSIFEKILSQNSSKKQIGKAATLAGLSMFSIIIIVSSKISINNLDIKVNHSIDYKSLARYLKNQKICERGCLTLDYDPQGKTFGANIDAYYFGDAKLVHYDKRHEIQPEIQRLMPIIGSYKTKKEIMEFSDQYPKRFVVTSCSKNLLANQRTPFVLTGEGKTPYDVNSACIEN